MTPKLTKQVVNIGRDVYGRSVEMTRRTNYDGKRIWSIKSHQVSQRDDGEGMDGLSDENIRAMVAALDVIRKV